MAVTFTLKPFLISPPFGNYLSHPNATRVRGSFTRDPRPGLLWHSLRTIRPVPGGVVNRVGLRNPGIASVVWGGDLYSLVGLKLGDWYALLSYVPFGAAVELNWGCPNVGSYCLSQNVISSFVAHCGHVQVKLSPGPDLMSQVERAAQAGVTWVHLSNTLPSARGGISGDQLRAVNLPLVKNVAKAFPSLTIIGGGGIKRSTHVRQYADAGARHFSIATAFFQPWAAYGVLDDLDAAH